MTTGTKYCEHYPEGLPVCSKCREESTLAHDKACALLAAARADAEHWKSECNALQRMAHEARAEIENLKWHINNEKAKAEAALELNGRALELVNEARAEIERLKEYTTCTLESADASIDDKDVEIIKRDKLIEQMKSEIERLKCCGNCEYCNQRIEVCEHPDNEPEDVMKGRCENWQHDAEAAERGE